MIIYVYSVIQKSFIDRIFIPYPTLFLISELFIPNDYVFRKYEPRQTNGFITSTSRTSGVFLLMPSIKQTALLPQHWQWSQTRHYLQDAFKPYVNHIVY